MEMKEDRINGEEILTEILNIVGEDILNFRAQDASNSAYKAIWKKWRKIYNALDDDAQVCYDQIVGEEFFNYQEIIQLFTFTHGLVEGVCSSLKLPESPPGLSEAEQALSQSWEDFAGMLSVEHRPVFYEYVKAEKAFIEGVHEYTYLYGYELALTILSNFGIKTSGNRLAELYAKLE